MKRFLLLLSWYFFCHSENVTAQCALLPIELSERVSASELVVEAVLEGQYCFRSESDGHIYTANQLRIYRIFKGNPQASLLTMISPGGYLDESAEEVIPSIYVEVGMTGVVFLVNSPLSPAAGEECFKAFGGPQGCIYFDLYSGTANDVFRAYSSVEDDLYPLLRSLTSGRMDVVLKPDVTAPHSDKSATVIDSVSPAVSAAGIGAEVRIRGSGFGASQSTSTVSFTNASTGVTFIEPLSSQYKYWSDTLIRLHIPTKAGTGAIRVTTASGTGIIAGPQIKFSHLNYITASKIYYPYHKDDDGNGGFTWRMSTQFNANTGAKDAFIRAMNTWRDSTCINWINGTTTSSNLDMSDGINIVRFAGPTELEAGVLGITRNYYDQCDGSTAFPKEIDLSYDPDVDWHTGTSNPSFSQMDMESVIVHELGHAHQLGHVKDAGDFMYATISKGQVKRKLVAHNVEAGIHVMKFSVSQWNCGPDAMVPLSGCIIPVEVKYIEQAAEFRFYPNPFSEYLVFEGDLKNISQAEVFNVYGQKVAAIEISAESTSATWYCPANLPEGLYIFADRKSGLVLGKVLLSR